MSNLRSISTLTCAAAVVAAQAAVARGTARGVAVVATVVDAGGHLLAAIRADGAFTASIDIARDKAWTAATFGLTTDRLCEALSSRDVLREGIALRPGVVLFGGGLPIVLDGATVGAIGVSGGSEDDDRACAAAGLAALSA
ncbi:GlcG/HbpS family heme-binding protein [Pinisolibacter sp.]|uniref:GlcG/HbpS family heme-binding protein n=1 Tax=Pinisolibacter sp. TaxID=2172024 RepID=UPI002FDE77A1